MGEIEGRDSGRVRGKRWREEIVGEIEGRDSGRDRGKR